MLTGGSARQLEGFLKNLNNPPILGLDAREVFFLEDSVILVEGQEDVVGYQKIASELEKNLKGTFFGWGVGGAHNIEIVASVLSDLGFEKVAGILDDDKKSLIPALESKFPNYHFFSIPAKDVRSKSARPETAAIAGLLDGKGKLKPQYHSDIDSLFDKINSTLS